MVYIVMDLEWNQSCQGKSGMVHELPVEIIEIGAVKLSENREIISRFQQLIRPVVYKKLHFAMRSLLHISEKDLESGVSFNEAAQRFFSWCAQEGSEYCFCTWGNMDLLELQRNCRFFQTGCRFSNPLCYYDLQKLYMMEYTKETEQVALETAAEALGIAGEGVFHRALVDAEYTAQIFMKLSMEQVLQYPSIDYYQLPETKKQEIHMVFPTYEKMVSRKFATREAAAKDRILREVCCPICKMRARRKIRWFTNNLKNYYSLSQCSEHGYIRGKLRIRKHDDGSYYVIRTIRPIDGIQAAQMVGWRKELSKKKKKRGRIK